MMRVMESLEGRRHLSASLSNGVLTIPGTSGKDSISITQNGSSVVTKVNSLTQSFKLKLVTRTVVTALGGNDSVSIASNFTKPSTINGGDGNDSISGGGGADNLVGGAGNDFIAGLGGNDKIRGGLGDDHLEGGSGNDDINGETGNDNLYGGIGVNTLTGGAGDDAFHSSGGKDGITDPEVIDLPPVDETFIYYDFDENGVLTRYDISLGQIPPSWTRLPPITNPSK